MLGKRLKVITSHVGVSRWLAECTHYSNDEMAIGWLPRDENVPSPYAYSPVDIVTVWRDKPVVIREVAHKRWYVFALAPGAKVYTTEQEAEDAKIASLKETRKDLANVDEKRT